VNISANQRLTTNVLRRALGIALAFSPAALLLTSIVFGVIQSHRSFFFGLGWVIPSLLIAVLNFYLSFIRPLLFHVGSRWQSQLRPYRHVSGLPAIGTILISIGALLSFGAVGTALIGICAFALDTGGAGWFVISTWRDRSLWDA
jgi:hypothetical protein